MPTPLKTLLGDARSIPIRTSNAATNLLPTDRGGCVRKDNTNAYTFTIRTDALEGWDDNASILVANDGLGGNLTVAQGAGVTIVENLTTGNVMIPPGQSRLLHRTGANAWRAR